MNGHRFFWVGAYARFADATTLQNYDAALQEQFGLVPVGAPVYRTFSGSAVAFAAYQTAVITVLVLPETINIAAWFRIVPDVTALKQLTISTFGLTGNVTVGDDTVPV